MLPLNPNSAYFPFAKTTEPLFLIIHWPHIPPYLTASHNSNDVYSRDIIRLVISNPTYFLLSIPISLNMKQWTWNPCKLPWRFYFFFTWAFFFFFFRTTPMAYGGSQARGRIIAVAAGLCHSHSNAGSKQYLWPTSQLTATPDSQPIVSKARNRTCILMDASWVC